MQEHQEELENYKLQYDKLEKAVLQSKQEHQDAIKAITALTSHNDELTQQLAQL